MTYRDIIKGCRGQKQTAQLAYYELFAQALFTSAYRLLNSEWEAEEAVQEVLLQVLTNGSLLLDNQEAMHKRLRRMVINKSIDFLRKRKVSWEEWDDNLVTETEESIEESLIRQEHLAHLRTAIAMMNEKDRTILLLAVVEELDTAEISRLLGIKPASVRSQLSRAKQKLIKSYNI